MIDAGTFTTKAGRSPGDTADIAAGLTGNAAGGFTAVRGGSESNWRTRT